MKFWKRLIIFAAGCSTTIICIWILASRVDRLVLLQALNQAGWIAWLSAVITYLVGFTLRGLRWSLMLRDIQYVPLANCQRSALLGYAANNILPFRLGELVRCTAFSKQTGISSMTTVASIFTERLLDALALVLILAGTLTVASGLVTNPNLQPVMIGAGILGGIGAAFILTLILAVQRSNRAETLRFLPTKILPIFNKLAAAGSFLCNPKRAIIVGTLSILIWIWEGLVFVLIAHALNVPSPLLTGYLMLGIVNLGILIPSAPGYIGVFQAAAVLAGSVLGMPESTALAIGLLVHAAQFIPVTVIGLFLAWPIWNDIKPLRKN
jgi:uncharacterized protein (TIRG00374 family)